MGHVGQDAGRFHAAHRFLSEGRQPLLAAGSTAVSQLIGAVPCQGNNFNVAIPQLFNRLQPAGQHGASLHGEYRLANRRGGRFFQIPALLNQAHRVGVGLNLPVAVVQQGAAGIQGCFSP